MTRVVYSLMRDTTDEAEAIVRAAILRTSPVDRMRQALMLSETLRGVALSREALSRRAMFNVVDPESGWKADFIVRKSRPFSESEFTRRESVDYQGISLPIVSLEDIVLSKLEWANLGGSVRQIEDVRALVRISGDELDRAYVEGWADVLGVRAQWIAVSGG